MAIAYRRQAALILTQNNAFTWEFHEVLLHTATTVVADALPYELEAKLQFLDHQLEFLLLTA